MFFFLYNILWTLALIVLVPVIVFSKNRRLSERLGLNLPANPSDKKSIWIHALSVGEVISAVPLIKAVIRRCPSQPVVVTVKTLQGMEVARKELEGEAVALMPMPVDHWWSVSRIFRHINPSVLILVEGDIWPGLLSCLYKNGVRVLLVNGRVSPRTFKSYKRFRSFVRPLLNKIELFLMQTEADRDRLIEIGLSPEKIKNTGNIKFDRPWRPMETAEHDHWMKTLDLQCGKIIWVAGSTHDSENETVLDVYKRLKGSFPGLFLVIAPRKTETAGDVHRACVAKGLYARMRSNLGIDDGPVDYEVLILDTIGELERIYGLADISFVGGSMVPVGGHNLLEPAAFGTPVLFGRYMYNFFLMSQLLADEGGGLMVEDGEALFIKMNRLLSDRGLSAGMGLRAKEFVIKNSGALGRIMTQIGGYINGND